MKINEMTALLSGEARTAAAHADAEIISAYAGDMLSDVLALGSQPDVLLTGLLNPQVIRTAEMLDTACVVFLRGKEPEASLPWSWRKNAAFAYLPLLWRCMMPAAFCISMG